MTADTLDADWTSAARSWIRPREPARGCHGDAVDLKEATVLLAAWGRARTLTGRRPLPTRPTASSARCVTRAGSHRGTPTARGVRNRSTHAADTACNQYLEDQIRCGQRRPAVVDWVLMSFQPGTLSPIVLLEHQPATGPRRASRRPPRHEGYAHRANINGHSPGARLPTSALPSRRRAQSLQTRN